MNLDITILLTLPFPFNQTSTDSWHTTFLPPVLEPLMAFYFPFCSAYSCHSCMDHLRLISIPPQLWLTASAFAAFFLLRGVTGGGICEKEFNAAFSMLVLFAILFPLGSRSQTSSCPNVLPNLQANPEAGGYSTRSNCYFSRGLG